MNLSLKNLPMILLFFCTNVVLTAQGAIRQAQSTVSSQEGLSIEEASIKGSNGNSGNSGDEGGNGAALVSGFKLCTSKRITGRKVYELRNHVQNIPVTITDKKLADHSGPVLTAYHAEVNSWQDHYAYGSEMPGRTGNVTDYRYSFNAQEKDDEILGVSNSLNFDARFFDARVGRWSSMDPLFDKAPGWSPYRFGFANPVFWSDPTGRWEDNYIMDEKGNVTLLSKTDDDHDMLYAKADWENCELQKGLKVQDKTLLPQMAKERTDVDGNYAISASKKEIFNIFHFAVQNSYVEWSMDGYKTDKSGEYSYVLNTSHIYDEVFPSTRIEGFDEMDLIFDMHVHPADDGTKGASGNMKDGRYFSPSDMANINNRYKRFTAKGMKHPAKSFTHQGKLYTFPKHYVYHKKSQVLYNYTPWDHDIYIKKINQASDFLFMTPK